MCDCLLQSSVSLSFLSLTISNGSMEHCSSLSSRQDTVSPTDTACSSESPAFLAGPASHLLMYDQNSSEEELEVINGGGGILEGGSSECPGNDRVAGGSDGNEGGVAGGGGSARSTTSTSEGLRSAESSESVLSAIAATSSGRGRCSSLVNRAPSISDSEEGLDDGAEDEELCLVSPSPVPMGTLRPVAITPSRAGAMIPGISSMLGHGPSSIGAGASALSSGATSKRCSSNNLLEKRKRSLAHSSDDEVRQLLEQQHHHHHHHHHHHLQQPLMSAPPVNFRTSPPLEALKPHNRGGVAGHGCSILQRSTTPLILTESGRGLEHIRISSSSSISSTASSLSSLGGGSSGGCGTGLFGAGLPSSCDSPLTALVNSHHHLHHHQQPQQQHHHHHQQLHQPSQNSNNLALLSTTTNTNMAPTGNGGSCTTSSPTSPMPMPLGTLVTNTSGGSGGGMDISRSVSPPAKVFHCAVSPRRRQTGRHHQQRLQRPHRPCLDFDKMQQVSIYRFDAIPRSRGFGGSAFAGWKCAAV